MSAFEPRKEVSFVTRRAHDQPCLREQVRCDSCSAVENLGGRYETRQEAYFLQ